MRPLLGQTPRRTDAASSLRPGAARRLAGAAMADCGGPARSDPAEPVPAARPRGSNWSAHCAFAQQLTGLDVRLKSDLKMNNAIPPGVLSKAIKTADFNAD